MVWKYTQEMHRALLSLPTVQPVAQNPIESCNHDTGHRTDETDSSLLVLCAHSHGRRKPHMTQGPGGCTEEQREPAGAAGSRHSVAAGWGAPGPHGRMGLACVNNSTGWQGGEIIRSRTECGAGGPAGRGTKQEERVSCWVGTSLVRAGNSQLGLWGAL